MPRSGRKTRRWAFGCSLLVAILAAAMWLSLPRERLLLEVAHPVLAVDTRSNISGTSKETVYWLTTTRLLILMTEHDGSDGRTTWKGYAELFDIGKHSRTRLVGITNLLNRPGRFRACYPCDFKLSPTGTRLYWSTILCDRVGDVYFSKREAIATLEGNDLREWPIIRRWHDENGEPCFWTDDQHLVETSWREDDKLEHLTIRDASNIHLDRIIKPYSAEFCNLLSRYGANQPLITNINYSEGERAHEIFRYWFDSRSAKIALSKDVVSFPKDTHAVGSIDEAPHQSTVIFDLQRNETPLLSTWLHRFIPSISVKPTVLQGLWVARPGVQTLQEIGHILVHTDKENKIVGDQLEQIQWLPDGRHLSFAYRGMLYIVSVQPAT